VMTITIIKSINTFFCRLSIRDIKNQISKCKIKELVAAKRQLHNFDF